MHRLAEHIDRASRPYGRGAYPEVGKACDKAMRDAMEIEETMKGPGTKDELLVCRLNARWFG